MEISVALYAGCEGYYGRGGRYGRPNKHWCTYCQIENHNSEVCRSRSALRVEETELAFLKEAIPEDTARERATSVGSRATPESTAFTSNMRRSDET